MMDYMCTEVDSHDFPALKRIQSARQDGKVLYPARKMN